MIIEGSKKDTCETILQHLASKNVVELQIKLQVGKDNIPYYNLKDSTYIELYQYLIENTK